jgi:ABC-type nitrate/sulfonate/bicarbonate transport system ATPase subunit
MAQAVALDTVSKQFSARRDPVRVLDGLSLRASPGEIVAVLGPSGCGKSTILRLIGGLEAPTGGQVVIGDRPVTTTDDRCSVVFQEPRLLPWRDVASNVALGADRRRGGTDERARDLIQRLLARVSLTDFARSYPHQLSGGMAQRVALARGLAAEPEVLLLDEPFAALDALTRMRMQDLLMEVWSDRKPTVVLVTHDVDEALYLADRIVILGGTQPASIVAEITIPVTRPRDHNDEAFFDLRAQILGHFGLSHRTARPRHGTSRDAPSIAAD